MFQIHWEIPRALDLLEFPPQPDCDWCAALVPWDLLQIDVSCTFPSAFVPHPSCESCCLAVPADIHDKPLKFLSQQHLKNKYKFWCLNITKAPVGKGKAQNSCPFQTPHLIKQTTCLYLQEGMSWENPFVLMPQSWHTGKPNPSHVQSGLGKDVASLRK